MAVTSFERQPVDSELDVGAATIAGKEVKVDVYSGSSVLEPGTSTGTIKEVGKLLSPIAESEVGTIRCIGLNYAQHANEVKMAIPDLPTLFMKPSTALADPYPSPTIIPKFTLEDDCCDYESELVIVIGGKCKDVSEADALNYVFGIYRSETMLAVVQVNLRKVNGALAKVLMEPVQLVCFLGKMEELKLRTS
ncbi:hypothetical protein DID88_007907 [Monilinia fructigena]|uniref:Fumarylacetoacetase-like C-terminal domain-containing protein n=1 Tax=Monilinia fructigena TaxID=38457 RepID=A0A395J8U4_9HELO|nr:hypothetical protein DID88_007907 [Monilinia fructigena]